MNKKVKPELLAPSGDYKSFIAAVEAGADAVYFGGKDFSARSLAVNLTREEIKKAIDYAHLRGVKCYAAVNTLVKDSEFAGLFDFVNFLYSEGIDALIVQDLGVFNFCQINWPDMALHASTQMTAHNLNDVLILQKMGFKRVVLARELTLEEIKEIKNKAKVELECFAHGALCFSYSGQCLLSSMLGGRSGNRGRCAQGCRKKYSLADFPPLQRGIKGDLSAEKYLLSARDLCALDILDNLRFIDSLKIEGRMKGAAYVGGAVKKYRKVIESAAKSEKITEEELEADKKELAAIFNRGGFSRGYYLEKKPKDLVSDTRSKNFGVLAGEVMARRERYLRLKVTDVGVNDGLEIWGKGGQERNIGFRAEKISGNTVETYIDGDIEVGDKVYKNFDYDLNKRLEALSQENYQKKMPVKIFFEAVPEKNILLKIESIFHGISAEVKGKKGEKAFKITTTEEKIKEQLGKLGGTPFAAERIEIKISGDLNIPLKDINGLRREAIAELENKIINLHKRDKKAEALNFLSLREAERRSNPEFIALSAGLPRPAAAGLAATDEMENFSRKIAVQSNDPSVLDALIDKKISRIYTELKIDIEKFNKNNIEVFQSLPRILRTGEKLKIFEDYNGFLAPALGYLEILPERAKKIGDFSLNIFNSYSAEETGKLGFAGFTASVENTLEEINNLAAGKLEKEIIVYGYLPLMISEHCVFRGTKYCRKQNLGIKDIKQIVFPIAADCANCRMQILNSVPLYFTDTDKLEADSIRLVQTVETPKEFLNKLDNYLTGNFTGKENTTTGHFYRGVE